MKNLIETVDDEYVYTIHYGNNQQQKISKDMIDRNLNITYILDAIYGIGRLIDKEQLSIYKKLHNSYGKEFDICANDFDISALKDAVEHTSPTPGSRPKVTLDAKDDKVIFHVEFPTEGKFFDYRSKYYDSDFDGLVQILQGVMNLPSNGIISMAAEMKIHQWCQANGFYGDYGVEANDGKLTIFPKNAESAYEIKRSGIIEILTNANIIKS